VATLVLAGKASAIDIGVVDDFGIAPENAPWFFDSLADLGMRENRVSIFGDPAAPTPIQRQQALEQYVSYASMRGIRVISPSRR
jgi:hypothetical protein